MSRGLLQNRMPCAGTHPSANETSLLMCSRSVSRSRARMRSAG